MEEAKVEEAEADTVRAVHTTPASSTCSITCHDTQPVAKETEQRAKATN